MKRRHRFSGFSWHLGIILVQVKHLGKNLACHSSRTFDSRTTMCDPDPPSHIQKSQGMKKKPGITRICQVWCRASVWIIPASITPRSYDSCHNLNWIGTIYRQKNNLYHAKNHRFYGKNPLFPEQNRCVTPRLMEESGTSLGCATLRTSSLSQDEVPGRDFG